MINDTMTTVEVMQALLTFYGEVYAYEEFRLRGGMLMARAGAQGKTLFQEWEQTAPDGTCYKCHLEVWSDGNLPSDLAVEFRWRKKKHFAAFGKFGVTVFSQHSLERYRERVLGCKDITPGEVFYRYIHPNLSMSYNYMYTGPKYRHQRYTAVADALFMGDMSDEKMLEVDGCWYNTCISAIEAGKGQIYLMVCLMHQRKFAAECGGDPYTRQNILMQKRHDAAFRKRFEDFLSIEYVLYRVGFDLGAFQIAFTELELKDQLQSMYRLVRPDTPFIDLLSLAESSAETISRDLAYIQAIEE